MRPGPYVDVMLQIIIFRYGKTQPLALDMKYPQYTFLEGHFKTKFLKKKC